MRPGAFYCAPGAGWLPFSGCKSESGRLQWERANKSIAAHLSRHFSCSHISAGERPNCGRFQTHLRRHVFAEQTICQIWRCGGSERRAWWMAAYACVRSATQFLFWKIICVDFNYLTWQLVWQILHLPHWSFTQSILLMNWLYFPVRFMTKTCTQSKYSNNKTEKYCL